MTYSIGSLIRPIVKQLDAVEVVSNFTSTHELDNITFKPNQTNNKIQLDYYSSKTIINVRIFIGNRKEEFFVDTTAGIANYHAQKIIEKYSELYDKVLLGK